MKDNKQVIVNVLPICDFCDCEARYDAQTKSLMWANMCPDHWKEHAMFKTLGIGKGQNLILPNEK